MTNELETLRPEVRDAWNRIIADEQYPEDFECIRAELLRLAMIEADALIALDCEHDWQVEHKRAEKAEAELAALKSATCDWVHDLDEDTWDSACGERWTFIDGGPEENNVRFCQGCGKRVRRGRGGLT